MSACRECRHMSGLFQENDGVRVHYCLASSGTKWNPMLGRFDHLRCSDVNVGPHDCPKFEWPSEPAPRTIWQRLLRLES